MGVRREFRTSRIAQWAIRASSGLPERRTSRPQRTEAGRSLSERPPNSYEAVFFGFAVEGFVVYVGVGYYDVV